MLPVVNVCGRGEGVTGAAFGAWVTVGRRQPAPHRRRLANKKRDRRAPCAPPDNDMTLWPLGVIRSRLAGFRSPGTVHCSADSFQPGAHAVLEHPTTAILGPAAFAAPNGLCPSLPIKTSAVLETNDWPQKPVWTPF